LVTIGSTRRRLHNQRTEITTDGGSVQTLSVCKLSGLPGQGKSLRFALARCGMLTSVLESGLEPFVDSHGEYELHRDIVCLMIARYWFLIQTKSILLHERCLDYGLVWRYMHYFVLDRFTKFSIMSSYMDNKLLYLYELESHARDEVTRCHAKLFLDQGLIDEARETHLLSVRVASVVPPKPTAAPMAPVPRPLAVPVGGRGRHIERVKSNKKEGFPFLFRNPE
jgi:hypothetical protein